MPRITLYIAVSLDGYIAASDGSVEWLSSFEGDDEDYGYARFLSSMDALVMGSKTYEKVLTFGAWPYAGKLSFVFTQRSNTSQREDVHFVSGNAADEIAKLGKQGYKRIWLVGGAALIRSFRDAQLIDEYIISTIPVLLGEGIPLFEPGGVEEKLSLVSSQEYPSGLVQARYRIAR